jgi:sucrose-6F-phosphate phosphohydrolase
MKFTVLQGRYSLNKNRLKKFLATTMSFSMSIGVSLPQKAAVLNIAKSPKRHAIIPHASKKPASDSTKQVNISYNTAWPNPVVHYSVEGGEWKTQPMQRHIASAGPNWAHFSLEEHHKLPEQATLELVITDGQGAWDKAPGDQNYIIQSPGSYRLEHGQLMPVTTPPVLVITDLDDTLIGDDDATLKFTQWWRSHGVPAGGRLVYNTGRVLDLFLELLEEKAHCIAEPDLLISSVGTKIYKKESNNSWVQDEIYEKRLGKGWELDAVREAAYAALGAVGTEKMHFRPPSEMNDYKITVGVAKSALDSVLQQIQAQLDAEKVLYKAIVSGKGDWRFVDLVPAEAGKLKALEYATETLGFAPHQTVACGDSGNDLDMLQSGGGKDRHHAIVVGNAQEDLMKWARESKEPLIVEGHRAHGILEGLEKLGFKH